MNQQNAHEYLPLVQAMANGKTIQSTYTSDPHGWFDVDEVNFGSSHECYRIKPEPRTFEMWLYKTTGDMYPLDRPKPQPADYEYWERITVQEVLQ